MGILRRFIPEAEPTHRLIVVTVTTGNHRVTANSEQEARTKAENAISTGIWVVLDGRDVLIPPNEVAKIIVREL
jgi:hypothetical protein